MDFHPIARNSFITISAHRDEAEAYLRANPTAHAWLADTHEYGWYSPRDFTTPWISVYSTEFTTDYRPYWVSTYDAATGTSTLHYMEPAPKIDQEVIDELL